jgi:probable F420-dependent oxidoreductase
MGRARIGVTIYSVDYAIRPDELAREAEARGFESLWVPEHSNIPTSRKTPWPGSLSGEPLPKEYSHMHDAFVALSMAAAVTSTIRLGTGVMLPAQRDAIWTSKQISTLDFLSGGRVEVGVGIGWNQDEMESHGAVYSQRWDKTREVVEAMRELWRNEVAQYTGDIVHVPPTWQWPKPAQPGGPKVHLGGGTGPRLLGQVAKWADGWMPISARTSLANRLQLLREACDKVGRDPSTVEVSVFGATTDADGLTNLFEEGISRAILTLPPVGRDEVLPLLDEWAATKDRVYARLN